MKLGELSSAAAQCNVSDEAIAGQREQSELRKLCEGLRSQEIENSKLQHDLIRQHTLNSWFAKKLLSKTKFSTRSCPCKKAALTDAKLRQIAETHLEGVVEQNNILPHTDTPS